MQRGTSSRAPSAPRNCVKTTHGNTHTPGDGNVRRSAFVPDSSDGPTVLRILLGTHLRRLREARGVTARQAAISIRASESKISRMELGRNAIREIDVLDLLTYYGVGAVEREQLLSLAAHGNR